jgi:hypothetical protein
MHGVEGNGQGERSEGSKVKRLVLLGLLVMVFDAAAVAGSIEIGLPVISGDVSTFENRQSTSHTDLSQKQLQALSHWFEQNRSGWRGMITPATSEPVQFRVNLRHSDGGITSMSVIVRAGGGRYLRLAEPGTWAYRSFGGILKSWAATRPLSDQELSLLLKVVGAA